MVFDGIDEMKQKMENMHRELLQLISTLSDGTLSDTSSLVCMPRVPRHLS
jgi:hypothetical protein